MFFGLSCLELFKAQSGPGPIRHCFNRHALQVYIYNSIQNSIQNSEYCYKSNYIFIKNYENYNYKIHTKCFICQILTENFIIERSGKSLRLVGETGDSCRVFYILPDTVLNIVHNQILLESI